MSVSKHSGRARTRRLPLRTVLIVLALVPSVALTGLLTLGMYQLGQEWRDEDAQRNLASNVGGPAQQLLSALQKERRLTAQALADASAPHDELTAQRAETDRWAAQFRPLARLDTSHGHAGIKEALTAVVRQLDGLDAERRAVDAGASGQDKAYTYYTGAVVADLSVFTALGNSSSGEVTVAAQTLVDLFGATEMISREDALLARGWKSGRLEFDAYDLFVDSIGTQEYLLEYRVEPTLSGKERALYRTLAGSRLWTDKRDLEERLIGAVTDGTPGGQVIVPIGQAQWRGTVDRATPELGRVLQARVDTVRSLADSSAHRLWLILVTVSVLGAATVALVIGTSWRLATLLRRRILSLRDEAKELQARLPEVVARLERGEDVDVEAEVPAVDPDAGPDARPDANGVFHADELGELAQALDLARRSAVTTAVRQAEQHRGFERLLQRIARRTQLLIGLQLRKLDEMERKHEDPEVLEGLFDLDHLTARLRRYEENLVILGGGQPQRRWRKPVPLLDVLRAAQGEVQDYRRISVEVEGRPWVSEWAVGSLTHILAELMENAAAFSKPPTPVEVRAGRVGRGIVVEIEDRGLGMTPAQYAAANALMQDPPQLDVMTRADDVRLGLYVVARLSAGLGVQVELRPSAFGGSRVIVLVPERYVAVRPQPGAVPTGGGPEDVPPQHSGPRRHAAADPAAVALAQQEGRLPTRSRAHAAPDAGAPADFPLPQRVRQASLADGLRQPAAEDFTPPPEPRRSGATIGAFQRQSRKARTTRSPMTTTED
ncbi:nitrate- and nitrite sensing domain-containing protein [Streptomyces sp. NBC_01537]|uniref:sensor histidine kinase n=1 Tax=Streptomyces sp. NBC_01537 TaxID=2903896 RepID=UPI00386809D9